MKLFKHILILISALVIITSCCSKRFATNPVSERITHSDSTVVTEVWKDSTFEIAGEKSGASFELKVTDSGKVEIVKQINSTPGTNLAPPKATIHNNVLTVNCEYEANQLFIAWKEKFLKQYSKTNKETIKEIEVPRNRSWIETTLMIIAILFLLVKAIQHGFRLYKRFK